MEEEREENMKVEVDQILHMVGGLGETSDATNSTLQEKAIRNAKSIVQESVWEVYCTIQPEIFVAADLGCSSGPTALSAMSEIIEAIHEISSRLRCQPPELMFFLNDLPGNDFNTLFESLTRYEKIVREEKGNKYVPYYVAGAPGSFYGTLFPKKNVHFMHSSYSLHWLSQGVLEEEKVDTFNLPFYAPAMKEVETVILNEGSFVLYQAHTFELNWDSYDDYKDDFVADYFKIGEKTAKSTRAVLEPMLASHFGDAIMDNLFSRYAMNVAQHLNEQRTKFVDFTITLKKRE